MASSVESAAASKKMIRLMSLDGEIFEVEEKAAGLSVTIKNIVMGKGLTSDVIPVPNVNAKNLSVVVEYCKSHVEGESKENGKKFDEKLVNQELSVIFELLHAANYLDIKGLLDLLCQAVANRIKGEPSERIRQIFNIQNDFTPEEEVAVRNENAWALQ